MFKINEINDAWIEAGQTVDEMNNKINTALIDPKSTKEDVEDLKNKRDNSVARRDALKEQLDIARKDAETIKPANGANKVDPIKPKADEKGTFVNKFRGMVRGDSAIVDELKSDLDANGKGVGLTIPQDIQTSINTLKRTFQSLEPLVTTENVSAPTGTRVIEPDQTITPFALIDAEDGLIGDNDDPTLTQIKYAIKRYAGISTLTNSLLSDSDESLLAYITNWVAKKDVITRNSAILTELGKLPSAQKTTVASVDALKDIYNKEIDPLIFATSVFITNQSGFAVLDKVKDNFGHYLLQPSITNPSQKQLSGKDVVVINDRFLPNDGSNFPLYIGDLSQAVHLFDLQQMSLLTTNIGAGSFEHDLTKLRAIDRFDVQLWDAGSVVYAPFSAIADVVPATGTPAKA